jgi:Tfp pilus assembly protein PilN
MRAVNLIPADSRRGSGDLRSLRGPGAAVVGLLGVALVLITLYVLATNSVSARQDQLTSLRAQLSQTRALATNLNGYTKFAQLAQARIQTVREIATTRFDWQRVLSDLSKVVPANTSLDSLSATVSPSTGTGGSPSGGGLRSDLSVPAFELQGCTGSQDDVASLMSRLRLIRGVSRVTLASAVKSGSGVTGSAIGGSSGASGTGGCAGNAATFDVVVFFQSPGAVPTSSTSGTATAAATPPAASSPPAAGTTSTAATTSTSATTSTTAPASSTTPTGGTQ